MHICDSAHHAYAHATCTCTNTASLYDSSAHHADAEQPAEADGRDPDVLRLVRVKRYRLQVRARATQMYCAWYVRVKGCRLGLGLG